jgi:hypothetical protein
LTGNRHVDSQNKITKKVHGGTDPNDVQPPAAIWTTTKQSMSYVTVRGIESDTSWPVHEWPKQSAKEQISNAYDFLRDHYPDETKETRKIAVFVKIESILDEDSVDRDKERTVIRILVRNSNVENIPVFENLEAIFNYTQFHSTKRNQHREVSGALGDFLKRGLGMGYALWTNDFDRESLTANSKHWPEPIILRYNGQERKVFLEVDWDNQAYGPKYGPTREYNAPDFTEVQVTLPLDYILKVKPEYGKQWILDDIRGYFNRNKIGNTNTEFSFSAEGFD